MAGEVELADDLGPQQRDDVGGDAEAEAGHDLLGHSRATKDVAPLEDQRLETGAGKVRGGCQAVVPAADDDRVVTTALAPSSCHVVNVSGARR